MRALYIGLLLVAACEKKAEPGSCYRAQENICMEYAADQGAAGKHLCAGMTWTPGASTCATTARLGACKQKDAVRLFYSGAPNNYDATSAKSACEHASGTWSAP